MFGQMTSVGHSFSQMESDLVCAGVLWEEEEWEERVLWEMVKNREAQYFPIHASWHTGGQEIAQGKCCRTYTHFIQLVSTSLSTLCVCVCFPVTVAHLGFDLHPTVVGVFLSSWVQLKVKKEKKMLLQLGVCAIYQEYSRGCCSHSKFEFGLVQAKSNSVEH